VIDDGVRGQQPKIARVANSLNQMAPTRYGVLVSLAALASDRFRQRNEFVMHPSNMDTSREAKLRPQICYPFRISASGRCFDSKWVVHAVSSVRRSVTIAALSLW
jgi:hypothetical protein